MDKEESDEELGDEIYQWIQNGKLAAEEKNNEIPSSPSSGLHLSHPCNKLDMQNNNACSKGGESQLLWRAKNALLCRANTERAGSWFEMMEPTHGAGTYETLANNNSDVVGECNNDDGDIQVCLASANDTTEGAVEATLQQQQDLVQLAFLQRFSDATR